MKKSIALIQMNVAFANPNENYKRVEALIVAAMEQEPDIIVLPETWNTGFFPKKQLRELADRNGERTIAIMSELAKQYGVNIVAGSISDLRNDKVYNTMYIFNREGMLVTHYDKVHGFTPSGEHQFYEGGSDIHTFQLEGISCASAICYDLRFPELFRKVTTQGVDLFFLPAQWPLVRRSHWECLNKARAIENQMYLCAVNSVGVAGNITLAGNSLLINPWGEELVHLGEEEAIQVGVIDLDSIADIRVSINVFRDRRPELY